MGWQSYAVSYYCKDEKQRINDAVKKHNDQWIAAEIISIYDVPELDLVLFGNDGGRNATFAFMKNEGLNIMWFEDVEYLIQERKCEFIPVLINV